jgi:hypothetical protein
MLDNIQYQAVITDSLIEVVVLQKLIRMFPNSGQLETIMLTGPTSTTSTRLTPSVLQKQINPNSEFCKRSRWNRALSPVIVTPANVNPGTPPVVTTTGCLERDRMRNTSMVTFHVFVDLRAANRYPIVTSGEKKRSLERGQRSTHLAIPTNRGTLETREDLSGLAHRPDGGQ